MKIIEETGDCQNRTIIQLSTPRAVSAIHILRLSGSRTKKFLLDHSRIKKIEPRRVYYSPFNNGDLVVDQVLLFFFQAPFSYTGEDMGEIHCHGSLLIVEEILKIALKAKLELADPGEFTKLAFLNGKLNLSQSEAIDVLIRAKSESRKKNALNILEKKVDFGFSDIKLEILNILSEFESAIEFPEEGDVVGSDRKKVFKRYIHRLKIILRYFTDLVNNYQKGMKIEEGIKIAIGGCPNAGKSTLMNAMLRKDRVLVSEIEGTTRDYVKEEIHLNGFPILLYDTAGIRETKDRIETAGIKKTTEVLKECDLQLFLISENDSISTVKKQLDENRPFLIYLNKTDILSVSQKSLIKETLKKKNLPLTNEISLLDKKAVAAIEKDISKVIEKEFELNDKENLSLLNERQKIISERILGKLKEILKLLKAGENEEVLCEEFYLLNVDLDALNLAVDNEELFDHLFKQFCIGK